jgi:hypothetical protein
MSDVMVLLMFDGAASAPQSVQRLLERSGWRLERVVPSGGPMIVLQASRTPTGS